MEVSFTEKQFTSTTQKPLEDSEEEVQRLDQEVF